MKNITICIATLAALLSLSACNDEWKEEHYIHMVSLKAPVNAERVSDIYLRYKPDGEVIFNLPVLVSGSTLTDKAMEIQIGVDNDTLEILNQAKYQYREDLYYQQLGEQYYELLSPVCYIPAGSNKELFQVKFKFSGLNLSQEWVLPLTIEENPSYVTNKRKGWRKALLHVMPYNDYSGTYSSSAMNIFFDNSGDDPLVVDHRKAHVVDENTVFFYVGTKADDAIDRETYKINIKFENPAEENGTKKKGNLEVKPANPDNPINFEVTGQPTYEIWDEEDPNLPYLTNRYYVLYMNYRYNDVTSVPGNPIAYRAEGSLTMQRRINTLAPDDDQAILW